MPRMHERERKLSPKLKKDERMKKNPIKVKKTIRALRKYFEAINKKKIEIGSFFFRKRMRKKKREKKILFILFTIHPR